MNFHLYNTILRTAVITTITALIAATMAGGGALAVPPKNSVRLTL